MDPDPISFSLTTFFIWLIPSAIILAAIIIFILAKLLPKQFVSRFVLTTLQQGKNITEEGIINIVEAVNEEGGIDEEEKDFINNIFEFNDTTAGEIMTQRGDMFVVNINEPPDLTDVLKSGFSRVPVTSGDIDNIIGIFHIKDLFQHAINDLSNISYRSIMRPPYLVPDNKKINELFQEFNQRKQHMAIVVDEFGGISGLITQEDILEELVGEIIDESDTVERNIIKLYPGNQWKVMGKTEIEEVCETLPLSIPPEHEYETFSGYVLDNIGRIPQQGEVLTIGNLLVKVDKVEGNRVSEYTVKLAAEQPTSEL